MKTMRVEVTGGAGLPSPVSGPFPLLKLEGKSPLGEQGGGKSTCWCIFWNLATF